MLLNTDRHYPFSHKPLEVVKLKLLNFLVHMKVNTIDLTVPCYVFFIQDTKEEKKVFCKHTFDLKSFYLLHCTDTLETSANTCHSSPFCLSTPNGYQLEQDFVKYVSDLEQSDIIRRLGFNRRPKANPETKSRVDPSQWASSQSLSSVSSDEARNPSTNTSSSVSSSVNRRRPPLPPWYSSPKSTSDMPECSQASATGHRPSDGKPPSVTQQNMASKPNSLVEKTLVETCRRLEQEKLTFHAAPPELYPRRRLASFGGLSTSGTLSPYTSWNALNQTQTQAGSKQSIPKQVKQCSSTMSGSLRISPLSSGRATPVTNVSPLHLQLVRDQMVVALERLKDLEEQVKTIPALQIKISILQEEKKQLIALVTNQESQSEGSNLDPDLQRLFRKRAHSTGSTGQFQRHSSTAGENEDGKRESSEEVESWEHGALSGLEEFKQLSTEMHLLEKKIQDARLATQQMSNSKTLSQKSVTVGNDNKTDCKFPKKSSRDVAVQTRLETLSTAVCVTEAMLGLVSDTEFELEMQHQTIQVLSDRVQTLETDLKEALLKAEMCRLKSELREAECHNRADKSSSAQPETRSTGVQTKAQTRTLGVGNHTQLVHSAVGGTVVQPPIAVGVMCRPETRGVTCGPDIPIDMWEVRMRVENRDQCVGNEYPSTCHQCVGTAVSVRDTGMVTLELMETLGKKKVPSRTVGCGDCTADVNINVVKPHVSKGTVTDAVRGIGLGVIGTPQTRSQCTNTTVTTISRCTSTSQAYVSESSTNTKNLLTREKHTNTSHVNMRTLAVGDGKVSDKGAAVKVRSVAVGTTGYAKAGAVTASVPKVTTRDTGVGLANINENYLVGLRTRNIACGPSRLPDPIRTRSIGIEVGDGRIRDTDGRLRIFTNPLQPHLCAQSEPGLDHYIDHMQKLLKEQQSLLTDGQFGSREEVTLQPEEQMDLHHGGIVMHE